MMFAFLRCVAVFAAVLCAQVTASQAREFAYVSLDGENRIAVYSVNETSGKLTPRLDIETPSPPGGLTSDPKNRFLFASLRRAGKLASFRINDDGGLTLINVVEAGADPAFVATDRTGRFLLTAYYVAAKVSVHRIGEDGSLSEEPLQEIATDTKAHAIMTDASNRLAFVPHTGPNAIYQFRFDEQSGQLSPNEPLIVNTGDNTGPRQLAFHPKRDLVFFDYEQGSAIAAFNLDRKTGRVSFRERLPSIPADFSETNSNARIEIHPSGDFVYVANRGHDSLAGYRVDAQTGRLISLGQTPTEPTPRGFTIEPTGRFLYAAGQTSNRLASFRIDQKSGALTRLATCDVGQQPWWVHVVRIR
ncbi:MAG: lactonase family protein [Rhodopirellula sp.]|nr:lactonase family protein [Rhodopirellula sp.]